MTLTDATGTDVTIAEEPDRIVTLWPSAAQPVWDIGADDKVVGLTHWSYYLDGAEERTNISHEGGGFDNEGIVDLDPDLVLAAHITSDESIKALRAAGLTVYKFEEPHTIDDIKRNVLLTGQLTGQCDGAERTVEWMNQTINEVDRAVAGEDKPRVLYVTPFGYGPGLDTFANTIIEEAGGENILAEVGVEGWGQVSEEIVVDEDPEWIVLNDRGPEVPDSPAYDGTSAVERNQVVVVAHPHINQPGPRIVFAMVTLANAFHDANIEVDNPQEWNREAFDVDQQSEDPETLPEPIWAVIGLALIIGVGALYRRYNH